MTATTGIIRAARRPVGWRAPGPPPSAAPDAALGPHGGEDLCYLAGDWRILQQVDGHRWSLDDLVTAWVAARVAAAEPPRRFLDLGCGIGTVLMLLAWKFPDGSGRGIEAQSASVDLARRSLAWNGATPRCDVRLGDFRDATVLMETAAFDLVTGTPPYLTPGHATASQRTQCGPCHFEERGGVEEYCAVAERALAPGGRLVMCAAVFQRDRVARGAAAAGLVVDCATAIVPREGKDVLFDVYVARRIGDDVAAVAMPDHLVVRDRRGQWTPAFRAVRAAMGMPDDCG
ncbi:MAG: methyltransferase domain-containing protein [Candidatus Binatia bacterium]